MRSHVPVGYPMIAVIQGAGGRQPHAGHMKTRDGKRVLFVADPQHAPSEPGVLHARPDDISNFGVPWRKMVQGYNANPRSNPLGLLPAHALCPDGIYSRLVEELGPNQTFILSPGWGLIKASFLTPNYDITLSPDAEPYRRRHSTDAYADFCMLPPDSEEDLYFFGAEEYVPLFCRLTAAHPGRRIVYHPSANPPEAPGCELRKLETGSETNWLHACATAFLAARRQPCSDTTARKVSHIESYLRETMRKVPRATLTLSDDGFEPDDAAVRTAIRDARNGIAEFEWLLRSLRAVDVTDSSEFQQRFNAFHRVSQRSPAWYATYYRLLETAKITAADFAEVLYTLWEDTGRYEPALASRLVATADPAQPFWDRFALLNTGLRTPAYPDPEKLEKAVKIYGRISDWYALRLASPGGQRIVELFDAEAPDHQAISALKKLEFVLRHTRMHSSVIPVVGQTIASQELGVGPA